MYTAMTIVGSQLMALLLTVPISPFKAVQDISVGVVVQGQPVRVHDLVENIRLNVIVDVNAHLGGDPADDTVKGQAGKQCFPP